MSTSRAFLPVALLAALSCPAPARAQSLDPAPAATAAGSVTLSAAAPGVFVERSVPATSGATLRGRARPDEWQRVCELPCTVPVDPTGMYRVDGSGISASRSFRLAEPARLVVETDASWKKHLGTVGVGVGAGVGVAVDGPCATCVGCDP